MRKTLLALGCAAAALGVSTSANAATMIDFTFDTTTATFRAIPIACDTGPGDCSGDFIATGTFMGPAGFDAVAGSVTTTSLSALTEINFTSGTLNGAAFTFGPTGMFEFGSVGPVALMAENTLTINGFTGGRGSFAGDLSFSSAAVPEPSTWALMLLGFAGIGTVIRRRRNAEVRANVQFA